jgi:hypothetical protein
MQITKTHRTKSTRSAQPPTQEKAAAKQERSDLVDSFVGFARGAVVGLASGAMGTRGSMGFVAGVGTATAAAAIGGVDPADSALDSGMTGALFGTLSAGMGAALGVPGVLGAALICGIRGAIGGGG